jgi:curli biogenesis system outer membrane secretion channel CsgG
MHTPSLSYKPAIAALMASLAFSTHAQTGSGGKDGTIEKCERNLGTLAVSEPQSHILASLNQYKLGSPSTMLRMIAQESNCFTVVERGVGMQNIQQERALASGGMLQQNANMGGGQLQAADFVLTPSMQFADATGGIGGAVGGLLGRMGGALGMLGGLAGGIKFKEAETTLLLADVRSGIQVASAEGQASKMDFSLGGWGWGGYGWASAGGYSKTPEGKLLAASLLDNFNRIVQQVRNKPSLVQASSASSQANANASVRATPLAPAMAAPTLLVQPAVAVMQAPPPSSQPGPPTAFPSVDPQVSRASGFYGGQITGLLSGPLTVNLTPEGMITAAVNLTGQPVLVLGGQINSNANGEFMLSGSSSQGAVMLMGRVDYANAAMKGNWFVSNSAGTAPAPGGSFHAKR